MIQISDRILAKIGGAEMYDVKNNFKQLMFGCICMYFIITDNNTHKSTDSHSLKSLDGKENHSLTN